MRYHVNDEGYAGPCSAKKKCPFGDFETEHYNSMQEATAAYEKKNSTVPKTLQKKKIGKSPSSTTINFFEQNFHDKKGDELFRENEISYNFDIDLGISSVHNIGELVENGYFSHSTVRGLLKYSEISSTSYEKFGFDKVLRNKNKDFERTYYGVSLNDFKKLSEMEMKNSTVEERAALRFFTSANYEWINDALYQGGLDNIHEDFDEEFIKNYDVNSSVVHVSDSEYEYFKDDKLLSSAYHPYDYKNKKAYEETIELLDSAMEKAPKKQRIVYRGISSQSAFLDEKGLTASEWLKNNVNLGEEIKFDGYQSTSVDFKTAADFSCDQRDGVIFEIRTSEGLNISSISEVEAEKEILLPRDSRYTVVGIHENLINNYEKFTLVQLVAVNEEGEILDGSNSSQKPDIE